MAASLIIFSPHGVATPEGRKDEKVTTALEQKEVAVTIYNGNLALVKDARRVKLDRDFNRLAWREVSAQIRPETAQLRNLTHPAGFRLQEQNFDFDLLTPEKLLEKYLGKEVTVIRTNPATGVPGRLVFPGVPENLRDKPTLVISLINPVAGALISEALNTINAD